MATATSSKPITPAELLALPDNERFELIDGELVERNMSTWSSYVAGTMYHRLRNFSDVHKLGWALPEGTSYQCFPHAPDRVRRADASFIQASRLSGAQATAEGHLTVAPDLAVEVTSPNDLIDDIDLKVEDYRQAGVRLVWVINPRARVVVVYRKGGGGAVIHEPGELDGEDVLPGFRCPVADLLALPPGVSE